MPSSKSGKSKASAAADDKQRKLKFGWVLRSSPDKKESLLNMRELPPAPQRPPKVRKMDLSSTRSCRGTSTRDEPPISDVASTELELKSIVHGMVDVVVRSWEQESTARAVECRTWLNAAIDFVEVHSPATAPAKVDPFTELAHKRVVYTPKQKAAVLNLLEATDDEVKISRKVLRLQQVPGYEKVTGTMIRKWQTAGPTQKRGAKVNVAFEMQVVGQLIYAEMEDVDSVQQALIKANVAHSYGVIQQAALIVQKMPAFVEDPKVAKLKFTKPWVIKFLQRAALRRRRVCTQEKLLPPPADVRRRMSEIQQVITGGDYTADEVLNADETGVFFGAPPKNQYVPASADRATAPESDDKARFTALLWGTASGKMGPAYIVIKMGVKGTDLSTSRVLDNLMSTAGFGAADGWIKKVWRRTLTLTVKKNKLPSSMCAYI